MTSDFFAFPALPFSPPSPPPPSRPPRPPGSVSCYSSSSSASPVQRSALPSPPSRSSPTVAPPDGPQRTFDTAAAPAAAAASTHPPQSTASGSKQPAGEATTQPPLSSTPRPLPPAFLPLTSRGREGEQGRPAREEEAEDDALGWLQLQSHLQSIESEWRRLQRINRTLRTQNDRLRARLAALEGPAANQREPTENHFHEQQRTQQPPPSAPRTPPLPLIEAPPPSAPPQPLAAVLQPRSVEKPVPGRASPVPPAPAPPSEERKDIAHAAGSEAGESSLESSDLLFRILFDERQRKANEADERRRQDEANAARGTQAEAEGVDLPASRPVAMDEGAELAPPSQQQDEGEGDNHSRESLSSAERLLQELEAEEARAASQARLGSKRKRDGEESTAAPAPPAAPARRAEPPALLDPFATQPLAAVAEPPLSATTSEQKMSDPEDVVLHVCFAVAADRRRGKELFQAREYLAALSVYDLAEVQLAGLLERNPDRPSAVHAGYTELAILLASRAAVHIKMGNHAAALQDIDKLKAFKGGWWKTHALHARALVGQRRLEEALAMYDRGLQCEMSTEERTKLQQKKEDVERKWRHQAHRSPAPRTDLDDGGDSLPRSAPPMTLPLPALPPSPASAHPLQPSHQPQREELQLDLDDDDHQHTPLAPAQDAPGQPPVSQQLPHSPAAVATAAAEAPAAVLTRSPMKASSQDPSLLPRITVDGVRDLLGAELFHRAEDAEASVWKYRIREEAGGGLERKSANDGEPAVVLEAKCRRGSGGRAKKRKRRDVESAEAFSIGDSGQRELLDVAVRFRGDRVMDWSCSLCSAWKQPQGDIADEEKGETGPGRGWDGGDGDEDGDVDHVDPDYVPCRHVGAVLLLLRSKQTAAGASASQQPPLFVHESHALPPAVLSTLSSLFERFSLYRVEQLKKLLQLNGERLSGVKEELVERCVEGVTRGVLPKCHRCGGSMFYANGQVHCKGIFDVDHKQRRPCNLRLPEHSVQRRPWRTE